MRFDAVLFDFDGTLADSMESILVCIRHALDGVGIPYTEAQLKKMVGPPFRVAMREMYGVTDEERVERLIKIYRTEYEHDGWHCELFAGIEDMLKETGVVSAGVLWGYGDRAELEAHGADYIVDKPEDVVSLVLGD